MCLCVISSSNHFFFPRLCRFSNSIYWCIFFSFSPSFFVKLTLYYIPGLRETHLHSWGGHTPHEQFYAYWVEGWFDFEIIDQMHKVHPYQAQNTWMLVHMKCSTLVNNQLSKLDRSFSTKFEQWRNGIPELVILMIQIPEEAVLFH